MKKRNLMKEKDYKKGKKMDKKTQLKNYAEQIREEQFMEK